MADRLSFAIIDANPLLSDGTAALLTQDGNFAARTVFLGSKPGETVPGGFDVIIIAPAQVGVTPAQLSRELRGRGDGGLLQFAL